MNIAIPMCDNLSTLDYISIPDLSTIVKHIDVYSLLMSMRH